MKTPLRSLSHFGKALLQVACLCLLAYLAQMLVERFSLPLPSGVLGLGFLLLLLALNWLPERFIAIGATWLVSELLLFFIPPVVASINYAPILEQYGANLVLTLVLGSVSVMVLTGFTIDRVFRFERRRNRFKRQQALKSATLMGS